MDDKSTDSKSVQQAKAKQAAKLAKKPVVNVVDDDFIDDAGDSAEETVTPKKPRRSKLKLHRIENTTKRVNVEIIESLHQDLFMCARFNGDTVQGLVTRMAEAYVAKVKKQMVSELL